jgi:hypothetical protein
MPIRSDSIELGVTGEKREIGDCNPNKNLHLYGRRGNLECLLVGMNLLDLLQLVMNPESFPLTRSKKDGTLLYNNQYINR